MAKYDEPWRTINFLEQRPQKYMWSARYNLTRFPTLSDLYVEDTLQLYQSRPLHRHVLVEWVAASGCREPLSRWAFPHLLGDVESENEDLCLPSASPSAAKTFAAENHFVGREEQTCIESVCSFSSRWLHPRCCLLWYFVRSILARRRTKTSILHMHAVYSIRRMRASTSLTSPQVESAWGSFDEGWPTKHINWIWVHMSQYIDIVVVFGKALLH